MKKFYSLVAALAITATVSAQIVINEVYGGGGNSGSVYTHDFVELINNSNTTQTLTGAYLQYASSSGNFGSNSNPDNNKLALPSITLAPGQKYLIQLASGGGGSEALPTPDFVPTGTSAPDQPLALSGSRGKIALTSNITSPTSATDSNVLDFVGWGNSNMFEGSNPAPQTTNSTSVSRNNGADTNDNSADFTVGKPTPQNSSSLATKDFNVTSFNLVKNTVVENQLLFGAKGKVTIYNTNGQVVKSLEVKEGDAVNVSSLPKGVYVVAGEVNGQKVSQKVIKK